jgi:hypothetical protein
MFKMFFLLICSLFNGGFSVTHNQNTALNERETSE